MLAAALKAHENVATQSSSPKANADASGQIASCVGGLNISGSSPMKQTCSQSLPSTAHFPSGFGAYPAKPRVRPTPAPGLSQLPILELPEPSPHSSSFLDKIGFDTVAEGHEGNGDAEEFERGGT